MVKMFFVYLKIMLKSEFLNKKLHKWRTMSLMAVAYLQKRLVVLSSMDFVTWVIIYLNKKSRFVSSKRVNKRTTIDSTVFCCVNEKDF